MRCGFRYDASIIVFPGHQLVVIERIIALFLERDFRHQGPHISEGRQAEKLEIVSGCGTGIVEVGHAILHEPGRAFLHLLF